MPERTAIRFTSEDLTTIRRAVTDAVIDDVADGAERPLCELIRIGSRSVGCAPTSLRGAELDEIERIVTAAQTALR